VHFPAASREFGFKIPVWLAATAKSLMVTFV
jgi:hypothetical protein